MVQNLLTEVELENGVKKNPFVQQSNLDERQADPNLVQATVDRATAMVLSEIEVTFLINVVKRIDKPNKPSIKMTDERMKGYYRKAINTLEILMTRLGIGEIFKQMSEVYERTSRDEPRRTLMKLLYRCLITHRQIKQLTRIFKLHYKRNRLYLKFKQ